MNINFFTKLCLGLLVVFTSCFIYACGEKEKDEPVEVSSIKSQIVGKWEGKYKNDDAELISYIGFEFKSNGTGSVMLDADGWINVISGKYSINGERIAFVGTYSEENITENVGVDLKISYLTNEKLLGSFNIFLPDDEEEDFWMGVELSKVSNFYWE